MRRKRASFSMNLPLASARDQSLSESCATESGGFMNGRTLFLLGALFVLGVAANAQKIVPSPDATTPPSITTQPASVTVKKGATAAFTVVASGTAPLKYQWYNGNQYPASPISGATSSTYIIASTADNDSGRSFYVTVSNTAGTATSNTAYLTVVDPPVIYQQPQGLVVTAPAVATFTVYAQGTWPMTYQWYKNGVAIAGATDNTFTSSETTTADNGAKFTVIISNSAGKVTSAPAILTVNPFNGTGTYPIVGEWSGTATITDPSGSTFKSQVVAGFTQNSYSVFGTIVFVDDNGVANWGTGIASLNNLNLFAAPDMGEATVDIAAGFSSNLLSLSGQGSASNPGSDAAMGSGTLTLSSDHKTLSGSATLSDGTKLSWTLTRTK